MIRIPNCVKLNGVERNVLMLAGHEDYSSSKTYINTLLTLFKGFGFDVRDSLGLLKIKMADYEENGEKMAGEVFDLIMQKENSWYLYHRQRPQYCYCL